MRACRRQHASTVPQRFAVFQCKAAIHSIAISYRISIYHSTASASLRQAQQGQATAMQLRHRRDQFVQYAEVVGTGYLLAHRHRARSPPAADQFVLTDELLA